LSHWVFCSQSVSSRLASDPASRSRLLAQATKGLTERYDALEELFGKLISFLDRLSIRLESPSALSKAFKPIAVEVLVELLAVLALSKKLLDKKAFGEATIPECLELALISPLVRYLEVVFGNRDMKEALQRLDLLTTREGQTTAAETFVAAKQVLAQVTQLQSGALFLSSLRRRTQLQCK